jgi:hypothetical protein
VLGTADKHAQVVLVSARLQGEFIQCLHWACCARSCVQSTTVLVHDGSCKTTTGTGLQVAMDGVMQRHQSGIMSSSQLHAVKLCSTSSCVRIDGSTGCEVVFTSLRTQFHLATTDQLIDRWYSSPGRECHSIRKGESICNDIGQQYRTSKLRSTRSAGAVRVAHSTAAQGCEQEVLQYTCQLSQAAQSRGVCTV